VSVQLFFYSIALLHSNPEPGARSLNWIWSNFPILVIKTLVIRLVDELELNLEQFDNSDQTAPVSSNEELELNLEQFDNTDERESDDLELNLDQFDNKNEPATQINNSGSSATRIEKTAVPKYNYLPLFIGGGLVFLAFMVILSRRGKRRR